MGSTIESEYGIRETRLEDKHGELDAWLERAIEVANFAVGLSDEKLQFSVEWKGEQVLVLAQTPTERFAILMLGTADEIPTRFRDLIRQLGDSMRAFNMTDLDTNGLLTLAREMEEDKKERREALAVIKGAMELIFADEVSQEEAEDGVLRQWAEALGENGWVRSGADLRDLTRLPILDNDSILIYLASPRYHPHYIRVTLGPDLVIEGIAATKLSKVGEGLVTPQESLATDEIRMVAEVLAVIVLEIDDD